jgi:arsenate reductase (glutaredoxin)
MYVVYGIKNCDTVKKALRWLDEHQIQYTFHDFKSKGASDELLRRWSGQVGWEGLVNKKGLTWKQLPGDVKESIINEKTAIALMAEKTSVIKRPVIELNGKIVVQGFNEAEFKAILE